MKVDLSRVGVDSSRHAWPLVRRPLEEISQMTGAHRVHKPQTSRYIVCWVIKHVFSICYLHEGLNLGHRCALVHLVWA